MANGYTSCACGTCFEIAIACEGEEHTFCHACEEAGCEADGECEVEDLSCPGCGCMPGDGRTEGCADPMGCGYFAEVAQ